MCTSITFKNGDFYFGRNMDLEYSFGECVTVTPRRFPFRFRYEGALASHYAMIGMAAGEASFPLYAEAVNEKGLCMAGLNFPGNASYGKAAEGKANAAVYELIPWLLGTCASVGEADDFAVFKQQRIGRAIGHKKSWARSTLQTMHFPKPCRLRRCTGCWRTGRGAL